MIPLGPFDLHEPVGTGGSATVWRASHRDTGVDVAVKVLTDAASRSRAWLAAFRNEIRAAAGLDHPHVARLFDHGVVPDDVAAASGGALTPGCPFLVMELAHGGSLEPRCGTMRWLEVREVLPALLDALAHAHARGVIHRDVKPANVLVGDARDVRPGIRLADFGLAAVAEPSSAALPPDRDGLVERAAGTPRYMAPEQVLGRFRDQGPWTDLYGLGRVTLALLMGELDRPWAPPPVPRGLAAWLARMLAPRPRDRFACAADAAWALRRLSGDEEEDAGALLELLKAGGSGRGGIGDRRPHMEPSSAGHGAAGADEAAWRPSSASRSEVDGRGTVAPVERRPPPMPADPDPPVSPRDEADRLGIGLALFPLRTAPLVGRSEERRRLWDALAAVRRDGRARAIVVTGGVGVGKSRLARWLGERALETGAAWSLSTAGGLGAMVARHLGCVGLSRALVAERVEEKLAEHGPVDAAEAAALAGLVAPTGEDGGPVVRFGGALERWALVERVLRRLARVRPVVLVADDADDDVAGFVRRLVGSSVPVLCVVVVPEDVAWGEDVDRLALGPLDVAERRDLVAALLDLEPALAARIADRCGGNPQMTVEIVRDAVLRGRLAPGPRGYRLVAGAPDDLPADLRAVWQGRVDRLLDGLPAVAGGWLERAAVLGADVDARDWGVVCDAGAPGAAGDVEGLGDVGMDVLVSLLERLLSSRLAAETEAGFRFAHAGLRESLLLRARDGGRLAGHHAACAAVLAGRGGPSTPHGPSAAERLGTHRLATGDVSGAVDAWLVAADGWHGAGDTPAFRRVLSLLDDAAERLADDDRRRGEHRHWRATLAALDGRWDDAEADTTALEELALANGWTDLRVQASLDRARAALERGRFGEAVGWAEAARGLASSAGLRTLDGLAAVTLGTALAHSSEVDRARECFASALAAFEAAGDDVRAGFCWRGLAAAHRQQGRLDDAIFAFERARACLEVAGARYAVHECLNGIGDVHRMRGDFAAAERCYREALAGAELTGSWHRLVVRLNLGLVLVETGRYLDAWGLLLELLDAAPDRPWLAAATHAACLPCAVAEQDVEAWGRHLDGVRTLLGVTDFSDADVARMTELAGDLARAEGWHGSAAEAYEVAVAQWRAIGDGGAIARVEAKRRET